MPEIIDGFTVFRTWTELGEGKFYPAIDVEMCLPDGKVLRNSRTIQSEGVFTSRRAAEAVARRIPVLGVATDGVRVIIRVDAL